MTTVAQTSADPMPLGVAIGMGAIFGATAILLIVTGVAAWRGRLPRNRLVGMRTYATLESDEVWDVAHRAAGRYLVWSGLVTAAIAGYCLTRPSNGAGAAVLLAGCALLVVLVIAGGVAGSRAITRHPS